jgi:hypothetical protein
VKTQFQLSRWTTPAFVCHFHLGGLQSCLGGCKLEQLPSSYVSWDDVFSHSEALGFSCMCAFRGLWPM